MNDSDRPDDIPTEVWSRSYDLLASTNTSRPIEGLDFLIIQEAMARAIMSNWNDGETAYPVNRLWFSAQGGLGE